MKTLLSLLLFCCFFVRFNLFQFIVQYIDSQFKCIDWNRVITWRIDSEHVLKLCNMQFFKSIHVSLPNWLCGHPMPKLSGWQCQHSLSEQFYAGCSPLDWIFFPQCDVIAFVAYIFPEVFDCSVQTKWIVKTHTSHGWRIEKTSNAYIVLAVSFRILHVKHATAIMCCWLVCLRGIVATMASEFCMLNVNCIYSRARLRESRDTRVPRSK